MALKNLRAFTYAFLLFTLILQHAWGQQEGIASTREKNTRILFIFDGSQSMRAMWEGRRKVQIARQYLIHLVDSLRDAQNLQMALRVYGHQSKVPPQDCNDTRLEVPFGHNSAQHIRQTLRSINPKGTTPIARSLAKAPDDFPPCEDCRNVVILITDGKEACEGDPCAVSEKLQSQGIILKPFIIGIGIDPSFRETFECAGDFHNAPTRERLKHTLDVVITEALNTTTAQINLLDASGRPTETNVPVTLYNHKSGQVRHNFMHTLTYKGHPDTLTLDPLITYDMVVHTRPPVRKDSIRLAPGRHNMIGVDASRGMIKLKIPTSSRLHDVKYLVRRHGSQQTLDVQKANRKAKYLTGSYDLEVLTLPRIHLEDVQVSQSHTTTIEIPKPGILNVLFPSEGYGSLFEQKKSGKLNEIYKFHSVKKRESLTLQPGKYELIFRPRSIRKSMYTIRKTFHIQSGASTTIKLN